MTTYIETRDGDRMEVSTYVEQLEDEIKELKERLEKSRGDGYDCAQGCAHCCSQHTCEDC